MAEIEKDHAGDEGARAAPKAATAATGQPVAEYKPLVNMAVAGGVGLLIGVLIGMNVQGDPPPSPAMPAASAPPRSPATAAPAATTRAVSSPAAVHFDLGPASTAAALGDGWKGKVRLQGRMVAVTTAPTATLNISKPLPTGDRWLAVVAKAVRPGADKPVAVTVTAAGKTIASWSLTSRWQLFASKLPTGLQIPRLQFAVSGASTDDENGPAMAVDHLQVATLTRVGSADLSTADGRSRLLEGFHNVEKNTLVWSDGLESTVAVMLDAVPGPYELSMRAYAYGALAPLDVSLTVNGKAIGGVSVGKKWMDHKVTVPAGVLTAGANRVGLTYPKTARPSDHGATRDSRELAVRMTTLALAPMPSPAPPQ